jgi:shikimate dehydrogenase
MKRVGLIGFPLAHSLSPVIQGVAFTHHGLSERYELWETEAAQLEERMRGLHAQDCLGANVTIPYKEAVIPYLDRLDALAERTGAVNTIVNEKGRLSGYNTDVVGFARALSEAGFLGKGQRAVVLGAGGAARAVGVALVEAGIAEITLSDIVPSRSEALAVALRSLAPSTVVLACSLEDESFPKAAIACQLLVNCTPVGMRHSGSEGQLPLAAAMIPPGAVVFDLVYNPPVTPLLAAAQARGARTIGGLAMLVYQAAASFRLWTGLDAPEKQMLAAAQQALGADIGTGGS